MQVRRCAHPRSDWLEMSSSFTDRILFQAYPTDVQSMLYIYKWALAVAAT